MHRTGFLTAVVSLLALSAGCGPVEQSRQIGPRDESQAARQIKTLQERIDKLNAENLALAADRNELDKRAKTLSRELLKLQLANERQQDQIKVLGGVIRERNELQAIADKLAARNKVLHERIARLLMLTGPGPTTQPPETQPPAQP